MDIKMLKTIRNKKHKCLYILNKIQSVLIYVNIEAVLIKRQPGDSPRTTKTSPSLWSAALCKIEPSLKLQLQHGRSYRKHACEAVIC